MEISKRDLIKFYAYLDNNDYLKDEHKTGKSMTNSIKNFIQYLSQHETSKVGTNKDDGSLCDCTDYTLQSYHGITYKICIKCGSTLA